MLNFLDPRSFCFLKTRTAPPRAIAPSHPARSRSAEISHPEKKSGSGAERERGWTLGKWSPGKAEMLWERRTWRPARTRRTLQYPGPQGPSSSPGHQPPELQPWRRPCRKQWERRRRKLQVLRRAVSRENHQWWRNTFSSLLPLMTQVGHTLTPIFSVKSSQNLGSGDNSAVRAQDLWSKGLRFESWQECADSFRYPFHLHVTGSILVILPKVQVAGYNQTSMHHTFVDLHEVTWHGLWLYGVPRTCQDGSSFTWHQPCNKQTEL